MIRIIGGGKHSMTGPRSVTNDITLLFEIAGLNASIALDNINRLNTVKEICEVLETILDKSKQAVK